MKLNYRDRMILLGVIAAAIILVGVFALIRPKAQDIKKDNKRLEEVKAEWSEIETKIDRIKPLQDAILKTHQDSKKLSDDFVDVSLINSTYKLDQFMQPYVDECNLEALIVDLADTDTAPLDYYYLEPAVLTSSMLDAADINGNYQELMDKVQAESKSLSERTAETVMQTKYGIMARGTRDDIWKFMKTINSLDTAILINSVNIEDYTFGENAQLAEGEVSDGKSNVTFVITLYSVFPMDEPVVE